MIADLNRAKSLIINTYNSIDGNRAYLDEVISYLVQAEELIDVAITELQEHEDDR